MEKLISITPETEVRGMPDLPSVPFLEMSIRTDGLSSIGGKWLEGFVNQSVSGESAPIWMKQFRGAVKAVWFNILPVGWIGEWHPSPALQWVVPLSGRWFIETQDGRRVEMGPGDIHWGADLNGKVVKGSTGHRSGQIGETPCVQIMLQFESVDA